MIRIPDAVLPAQANGLLEQYQAEVNGKGHLPELAELFAQAPEALAF